MITPELQTYIRQQLGAGVAKDVIKQNLFTQGWNVQDLDEAFISIGNAQFPQVFIPPLQPIRPRGHKGMWVIIVVILLLISAGGAYAAYHYGLFTSPLMNTLPIVTTTPPATSVVDTQNANTVPVSGITNSTVASSGSVNQPNVINPASCSSAKSADNITIQGKVIFPKGVYQRDYTAITGGSLDSNNFFCTQVPKGRIFNILLFSSKDENAFVLGATVNSQNDISDLIIDAQSTATAIMTQSLVIVFSSANMTKMTDYIKDVTNDAGVVAFANGIASATNLSINDIDTGGSLESLQANALKTVLITLDNKYFYQH